MQQKKPSQETTVRGADPFASTMWADAGVNADTRPPLGTTLDDPGDGGVTEKFLNDPPNYVASEEDDGVVTKPRRPRRPRRPMSSGAKVLIIVGAAVLGVAIAAGVLLSTAGNKKAAAAPVLNVLDLTNCEIKATDMGDFVQLSYPKGCKRLYHKD